MSGQRFRCGDGSDAQACDHPPGERAAAATIPAIINNAPTMPITQPCPHPVSRTIERIASTRPVGRRCDDVRLRDETRERRDEEQHDRRQRHAPRPVGALRSDLGRQLCFGRDEEAIHDRADEREHRDELGPAERRRKRSAARAQRPGSCARADWGSASRLRWGLTQQRRWLVQPRARRRRMKSVRRSRFRRRRRCATPQCTCRLTIICGSRSYADGWPAGAVPRRGSDTPAESSSSSRVNLSSGCSRT